jgi:hypothetical protein
MAGNETTASPVVTSHLNRFTNLIRGVEEMFSYNVMNNSTDTGFNRVQYSISTTL